MVGNMTSEGITYFYPNRVTSILSQFGMVASSDRVKELCCNVTTNDGYQCMFMPTYSGLHEDWHVFVTNFIANGT